MRKKKQYTLIFCVLSVAVVQKSIPELISSEQLPSQGRRHLRNTLRFISGLGPGVPNRLFDYLPALRSQHSAGTCLATACLALFSLKTTTRMDSHAGDT